MTKIYSNNIFNWVLIICSILTVIDTSSRVTEDLEYFNILLLRIVLMVLPAVSLASFFIKKMHKEIYSRLFILGNIVVMPLAVYYRFLVDHVMYSFTRTELISNPAMHINFLIGIVLFCFSMKFSRLTIKQRHSEFGTLIIIYTAFLLLHASAKITNLETQNFSVIEFIIVVLLGIGFIFTGNNLRTLKFKFKTAIITSIILFMILFEII